MPPPPAPPHSNTTEVAEERRAEMESFPVQFCKNISLMWRRRRYQRLDGAAAGRRRSPKRVHLGGRGGAMRRTWKVRRSLRLRLPLWSPLRLLVGVKEAYIKAMLGLAGKRGGLSGFVPADALWSKRVPKGRPATPEPMDFQTRILVEIYKSFLAPQQLAAL